MSDTTAAPIARPIIKVSTGPFDDVEFQGHLSVDERDTEAGDPGSTLRDADKSDCYRSTLPEAHEKFRETLIKMSGVQPVVNEVATALAKKRAKDATKVKDIEETFVSLATRAKAALVVDDAGKATWAEIDKAFRAIAFATPIDASPGRQGGGAGKANVAKAEDILSRSADAIEAAVEKLMAAEPTYDLARDESGKPEVNSLAKLVQIYMAKV